MMNYYRPVTVLSHFLENTGSGNSCCADMSSMVRQAHYERFRDFFRESPNIMTETGKGMGF